MPLRALALLVAFLGFHPSVPAALAQGVGPEIFGATLRAHAARLGVTDAVVVVRRGGREVHRTVLGRGDPARPEHVASISKSITAACVAVVLGESGRALSARLGEVAPRLLASAGQAGTSGLANVSIAQLITHRAGLHGNMGDGEVSTGGGMIAGIQANGPGAAAITPNARRALALGRKRAAGTFRYSNDGYVILGAAIEEMTGEAYERACAARVLLPSGISARLDRDWAFMGPFGGWSLSGKDAMTLIEALTVDARVVGRAAFDWHRTAAAPELDRRYGLGLRWRATAGGLEQWHTGSWNGSYVPRAGGPRVTAGFWNIVVRQPDGTSWYVRIDRILRGAEVNRFDDAFRAAYRSVTRW
jgi:CubicO group peptidase (beta-lactamase class C family)